MVVTRRTPAPPVPASRTQSTQPIPRIAKRANPDTSSIPDKSSPLANGSSADAAAKSAAVDVDKAVSVPVTPPRYHSRLVRAARPPHTGFASTTAPKLSCANRRAILRPFVWQWTRSTSHDDGGGPWFCHMQHLYSEYPGKDSPSTTVSDTCLPCGRRRHHLG